jgi:hypothetical protein
VFLRGGRIFHYKVYAGSFSDVLEPDRRRRHCALSEHKQTEYRGEKQYGQRRTHSSLVNRYLHPLKHRKQKASLPQRVAVMPLVRPGLVDELQGQLQLTRLILLARDRPEIRPSKGRIRKGEHNPVEEIE